MRFSFLTRLTLRLWMILTLLFLYLPLVVVAILSFNTATSLSWPPQGFTLDAAGNVTDVDPWKVIFNPAVPYEVPHMILAAYLLYRTPFDTSLFEDVGATVAAIAHTFQPRDRARPHR